MTKVSKIHCIAREGRYINVMQSRFNVLHSQLQPIVRRFPLLMHPHSFLQPDCLHTLTMICIDSTNVHVREFLHDYMVPQATKEELDLILHYYPSYPPAGCPFDTGFNNQIGPQYKRIAAIQGDFVFHGPRRMMLQSPARKEKAWSFRKYYDDNVRQCR